MSLVPVDWVELSGVGQSFGGISAALAAAALAALSWSIALQAIQTESGRMHAAREMQFNLITRALDDPTLAALFLADGSDGSGEDSLKQFRLGAYMTLHFRYLEYAFVIGDIDEAKLRWALSGELFNHAAFVLHWQQVRQHWLAPQRGREARFVQVMDDELSRVQASGASGVAPAEG